MLGSTGTAEPDSWRPRERRRLHRAARRVHASVGVAADRLPRREPVLVPRLGPVHPSFAALADTQDPGAPCSGAHPRWGQDVIWGPAAVYPRCARSCAAMPIAGSPPALFHYACEAASSADADEGAAGARTARARRRLGSAPRSMPPCSTRSATAGRDRSSTRTAGPAAGSTRRSLATGDALELRGVFRCLSVFGEAGARSGSSSASTGGASAISILCFATPAPTLPIGAGGEGRLTLRAARLFSGRREGTNDDPRRLAFRLYGANLLCAASDVDVLYASGRYADGWVSPGHAAARAAARGHALRLRGGVPRLDRGGGRQRLEIRGNGRADRPGT